MEKNGWKRSRNQMIMNVNENVKDCEDESINKKNCPYYSKKNTFYKKISIENQKNHLGLIDTGADMSVINKKYIPRNIKIKRTETKAESVTGNKLEVIGRVENIKAKIDE